MPISQRMASPFIVSTIAAVLDHFVSERSSWENVFRKLSAAIEELGPLAHNVHLCLDMRCAWLSRLAGAHIHGGCRSPEQR